MTSSLPVAVGNEWIKDYAPLVSVWVLAIYRDQPSPSNRRVAAPASQTAVPDIRSAKSAVCGICRIGRLGGL